MTTYTIHCYRRATGVRAPAQIGQWESIYSAAAALSAQGLVAFAAWYHRSGNGWMMVQPDLLQDIVREDHP